MRSLCRADVTAGASCAQNFRCIAVRSSSSHRRIRATLLFGARPLRRQLRPSALARPALSRLVHSGRLGRDGR
jgi:hypothetical protein